MRNGPAVMTEQLAGSKMEMRRNLSLLNVISITDKMLEAKVIVIPRRQWAATQGMNMYRIFAIGFIVASAVGCSSAMAGDGDYSRSCAELPAEFDRKVCQTIKYTQYKLKKECLQNANRVVPQIQALQAKYPNQSKAEVARIWDLSKEHAAATDKCERMKEGSTKTLS